MRCEGTSKSGDQCRRTALEGYNMCWTHGWENRFYIGFSWQEKAGDHWTDKKKGHWPILFKTYQEAAHHLSSVRPFKNMPMKRKLTACVETCRTRFPHPNLRKITP